MIRKFVRSVSRGRERPPSPEFLSQAAHEHDRKRRTSSSSGNRPSVVRDLEQALPGQVEDIASPGGSAIVPFYLDSGLEALSLETLIQPTLGRMRPKIREAEERLAPLPPLPAHSRRGSLTVPEAALLLPAPPRRTGVVLQPPPAIVVTPSEASGSSSSSSEHNPFELEFGHTPQEITPIPRRPALQRKAASYRTQRELPLRVQAVRRSHQEMYARQILAQSPIRRESMVRRASETEVPVRPQARPLQGADSGRSQSLANVHSPSGRSSRSRSASREGSHRRHERLPSGPHRARQTPPAEAVDYYLMAAMSSWSFDP